METSGVLMKKIISILFDSRAIYSFISTTLVDLCGLEAEGKGDKWQVELASGAKIATNLVVENCEINVGSFSIKVNLRVISLSSYGVILGMDWLGAHESSIDC